MLSTPRRSFFFLLCVWLTSMNAGDRSHIVEHTLLSRDECLQHSTAPSHVLDSMDVVAVRYYGFDNKHHDGQLVVNRALSDDVRQIFREIDSAQFPLKSIVPISVYHWSDDASIAENNTSAFNYRNVPGTRRVSMHAFGRAIDVNPWLNPWVGRSGVSERAYDPRVPGTIRRDDVVYRAFRARGWTWGGDWAHSKDYQHFEKR